MALSFPPADPQYVAYIDEAGDPGLTKVRPFHEQGSSEWLGLSAVVIRRERETQVTDWVKEIRSQIKSRQGPSLHYRGLTAGRKAEVCKAIANLPLRAFVLMSNKKNMQGYRNQKAELARGASTQEYFYNFCVRLLLERVTSFVEEISITHYGQPKHLEIVFSERGGLRYSQTVNYLSLLQEQARSQTTYLDRREIRWRVIHPNLISSIPHGKSAGAQLADPIASAFYQATNTNGDGTWDPKFAELLRPRIWKKNGTYENFGVSLQPTPYRRASLDDRQKQIFRAYGFQL